MKHTISKYIIKLIFILGVLLFSEEITSQNIGKLCTVEIKTIYKSPEFYVIIVEDIVLGDRYIIETSNHSISYKDCSSEFVEIFPKEPKLIHVGDTLQVELTRKYEFMESMVGQSYMHISDNPAYRYREMSGKYSTKPWPMTSPNINGLRYIPSVNNAPTILSEPERICTDPDCDPVFK